MVESNGFERYIGRYQLAPNVVLNIATDDSRLFGQVTGQSAFEMFPDGDESFRLKIVNATMTFVADGSGQVSHVVLHQNGADHRATRIDDAPPVVRFETARSTIAMDAAQLDRYVGQYAFTPNVVLAVTRDGHRLFVQLTGQPRIEVFADRERHFLVQGLDAQITFEEDWDGGAYRLVLHQNGIDHTATRIDSSTAASSNPVQVVW